MEQLPPISNQNLFFAPVNLDKVTESMVEVAVFAKNFFNQDIGIHPYFIEQECFAQCEGDFVQHAFNPLCIGHSPSPQMLRYDGNGQDKIATTFTLGQPINNGSLTWNIPMYIFDVAFNGQGDLRADKPIHDITKPKAIDPTEKINQETELPEIDFEELVKQYKLIARIEVIQRFILQDSVLTLSKNGITLLQLDLKQYPYVFG